MRDRGADRPSPPESEPQDLVRSARPESAEALQRRLARLPDGHPSSLRWREAAGGIAPTVAKRALSELSSPVTERVDDTAARSAWDASAVRSNADRPMPDTIRLTEDRIRHILDGDQFGGGHRHGAGHPGKTEFPARWSDAACQAYIADVARAPDRTPLWQPNHRWLADGVRDGVDIKVVVNHDGRIWTAWPEPGGVGVVRNPEET